MPLPSRQQRETVGEGGYVLVTALIALAVMAILASISISVAVSSLRESRGALRSEQALYLANAGLEEALARTRAKLVLIPGDDWGGTLQVQDGLTGTYQVEIEADPDPAYIRVIATGQVENATRRLTARLALPTDNVPVIYRQILLAQGEVVIPNNAWICGDVIATGDITLKNNAILWGRTTQQDPGSPCTTVAGTGRAISGGTVTLKNNAVAQGGICDSQHPCSDAPEIREVPPISAADLRERADLWIVSSAGQCQGLPEGATCTIADTSPFSLSGTRSYDQELIYVAGDIEVPQNATLRINGSVTFVASGDITLGNNARVVCGKTFCPVAFVAMGDIDISNNGEVHASLHTSSLLHADNNVQVFGNVIANETTIDNNYRQFFQPYDPDLTPPGLVLPEGGGYSGDEDAEGGPVAVPDGFAGWGQ